MQKYKLISNYPGRTIGDIALYVPETCVDNFVWETDRKAIPRDFQPDVTPNWFESVNQDYEIMSYKYSGNIYNFVRTGSKGREYEVGLGILQEKTFKHLSAKPEIHSVKRLSDGEIFTVGDRVVCNEIFNEVITGIKPFQDNYLQFDFVNCENNFTTDSEWERMTHRKFLLKTHDCVDIYTGDSYTFLWTERPAYDQAVNTLYDVETADWYPGCMPSEHAIFFSTREAGEKYLQSLTPIFTTEDGVKIFDSKKKLTWVRLDDMKYGVQPFVHNNLCFQENFKFFSTEAAAIDFINQKKPLFTTEDCVDIYEGDSWFYVAEGHKDVRKTCTLAYAGTNRKPVKRFSTEEAAREYIRKTTPILKTVDGVQIFEGDKYYFVPVVDSDKNYPYFSLQCSVASEYDYSGKNGKDFSTKELAEEFILMNKPCFSINDIAKVYSTATQWSSYKKCYSNQGELLRRMAKKLIDNE